MRIFGLILMCLSVGIFIGLFFHLAPWVASTIPACAWKKFLDLVIYVLIGWFGGLLLPIGLFIVGLKCLCFPK